MRSSQKPVDGTDDIMYRESWFKKVSRPLAIILGIAVIILVILVVIIAVLLGQSLQVIHKEDTNKASKKQNVICQDEDCIRTASRLLGSMKTEVNPCDNFYDFACGKWVESHRIPEDKGSIDTMEEVSTRLEKDLQDLLEESGKADEVEPIKLARMMYKSCMNLGAIDNQGTDNVLQFIREVGGWPVLDGNWNESTFHLEESVARARQYTTNYVWPVPHGVFMGINIINDFKKYGKHNIYLDQPSLLMEGRDMYLDNPELVIKAYNKFSTNVAVALGADPTVAAKEMKEMVELETEIAKISVGLSDRRDMEGNYRRMNISLLSKQYPKFDWLKMFQYAFKDTNVKIDESESVVLWMKPYYDELFPLIDRTPKRTTANYITWKLISKQFVAMEERFSQMELEFKKVTEGVKQLKPRGQRCSDKTNDYIAMATGRMYAEKMFGPKQRQHMLDMIEYIRRVFRDILIKIDWMDENTRAHALAKLENMKSLIGFPSFIFNNTLLTNYYKNITFSPSNFFKNMQTMRRYNGLKQLADLREPSYEQWPEAPAIVNAYYHSGLNAIVFPAGILQSPYYDYNYPSSINFGGIGLVIGHEITHGYDASGKHFDEKGLLHNWWSKSSEGNYNSKARCVIDHYSQFKVPKIKMNLNGNMTLSENIADIGGIKQAHLAYKLWLREHDGIDVNLPGLSQYSQEQLFFINTAQLWCSRFTDEAARKSVLTSSHSLPMFRVLGELRNSHGFSEAFNCPTGSYMNPDQPKCSLW